MTNREKLLGALVLAVLMGLGGRSVHTRLSAAYQGYANQERAKENELAAAEIDTSDGLFAAEQLSQWQERSLPSDSAEAKLSYQSWLRDQLDSAGIEEMVTPTAMVTLKPLEKATLLTYKVTGEGTLEALTDFLFSFYRARHLHKIVSLQVTPDDQGKKLDIEMSIEAYALSDSDRTSTLAEGESNRLALDSQDAYHDSIVERNIFAIYTPPREAPVVAEERPDPPFDHAKHARVTAILDDNKPQVWILVETTGDRHRLFEGESFKIDDLEVKIVEIDSSKRTVVYEADGQRYMVKLGKKNLREGDPIDPDQAG